MTVEKDRVALDTLSGSLQPDPATTRVDGQLELGLIEPEKRLPGDAIGSFNYIFGLFDSIPDEQLANHPQLDFERERLRKLIREDLDPETNTYALSFRRIRNPKKYHTLTLGLPVDRLIVFADFMLDGGMEDLPLPPEEEEALREHRSNLLLKSKIVLRFERRISKGVFESLVNHVLQERQADPRLYKSDPKEARYRAVRDVVNMRELPPERTKTTKKTVTKPEDLGSPEPRGRDVYLTQDEWSAEFAEATRASAPVLPPQLVPPPAPEPIPDILPTGYEPPPPGPLRPVRRI